MKNDWGRKFDDGMVLAVAAGVLVLCLLALTVALIAGGVILFARECL